MLMRTEQITLCRSGHFKSSAAYLDAIMHTIYQALLRLDAELSRQTELGAKTHRLAGLVLISARTLAPCFRSTLGSA